MNNFIDELLKEREENKKDIKNICCKEQVISFLNDIKYLLSIPYIQSDLKRDDISSLLLKIELKLKDILTAFDDSEIEKDVKNFMNSLSLIFSLMKGTLKATLNGDPACISYQEIVLSYPGYEAILSYRIAHELYKINQILLSRIITEEAHKNTGIDINPGATIGENLFIDHGTGIVIGETTVIGNNVKIYQGVTLGALSLLKGRELKGVKRHPTIEDNVTIYSNASILGGKTIIGKNSTIGANVYLVSSLEENTIVYLSESGIKKMRKQM